MIADRPLSAFLRRGTVNLTVAWMCVGAAMRQIARRSRGHVAERRARYDADPALHRTLIERFIAATAPTA